MGYPQATRTKKAVASLQQSATSAIKSPHSAFAHPMLQLQRQIGNRAVGQLIQAKLNVGKPGDGYEIEADHFAHAVMRMPDTIAQRQTDEQKEETAQTKSIGAVTPLIQRQAADEKEETAQTLQRQAADEKEETAQTLQRQATDEKEETAQTLQRQATDEKEETAQTKETTDQTPTVTPELEGRIQAMRGGGQPLAEDTRGFFESRFGYDFGGVRVHTGSQADEASRNLNAQAFTIGRDIFFGAGKYEPQTHQGKWLLAHELTHTLQQRSPKPLAQNKTVQPYQIQNQVSDSTTSRIISRKITNANQDPKFRAVVAKAKGVAKQQKKHAPAAQKAAQAQAAAKSPANEVASKAGANQVQQIDQQQPKPFNRAAFKAALLAKIAAIAPKTLKEADEFKDGGKVGNLKGDLTGQVNTSKKQSQGAIESKVKAPPDPSGITPRTATPLPPAETGAAPAAIGAAQAAPKPKTAQEVSLQEGSKSLDQQMQDADVTEGQLKKSKEPEFQGAVEAKQEAQTDAVTAPQAYRQSEQATLVQAQTQATATAQTQLRGMHGSRGQLLNRVTGRQQQTQSQDEQDRLRVANEIQAIYNQTKQKAEARLNSLDTEVNQAFDKGTNDARVAFEDYVDRRMKAYKSDRYSGAGAVLWVKDKLLGLPDEVNAFYQEGRKLYIAKMDAVLDQVAGLVETGLNEAKAEIAKGRQQVQEKVNSQPANLRKAAQEAAQQINSQFDQLEQSVNDKQQQLIDSLAQKYNDNLQKLDARIDEMQAENRGLVDKAKDAIAGVIKTILELKTLLLGVLAKAASAIDKIIKDPIGFLGNLVAGVKQGFMNFVGNIAQHLQKGLMGWLFGALAEAGIQLPESFDLKGIITLILQVLGLVYSSIRARAVKLLGEKVVKALETTAEIFKILITQGPGGLWEYIKDQLSNLKDVVIDGIKSFVTDSIIKAGVTWILGLLNPAGAFIKACKAIYDIVMFFVERGSQIIALVNAVLDSVGAIASGAIGAAAGFVENALSKAVPVVISFLAALLGVTGITDKIRAVIAKVQEPVNKAIDWVINKAYNLVKAAGKLLGFGKDKDDKPDQRNEQQKKADLNQALQESNELLKQEGMTSAKVKQQLPAIKSKYKMTSLELVVVSESKNKETVRVNGKINPGDNSPDTDLIKGEPDPTRLPIIKKDGYTFSAIDPAADESANLAGLAEWKEGTGSITLALYPKELKLGGKEFTEETRIRGGIVLKAFVSAVEQMLQEKVAEEKVKGNLDEAAKKYQIKGLDGVWNPSSDNTKSFNAAYSRRFGVSLEAAAWETFTGKQAKKLFGFDKVKINSIKPDVNDPSHEKRRELGFENIWVTFYS
ncbi:MAG: DUF4157 domain-containing protein [Goleter apudmare HA4340-LM2]|jgi:hypothetical protein|nr:DUF4157 domain-containing protein [Goleter apudmare HA4340-LM2]